MSTQITISRDGQQFGPYSMEALTTHLESGAILPDDVAWTEGMEEWKPLREVIDIETVPEPQLPAPPPPPTSATAPHYAPQSFDYRNVPWPRKALTINIVSYTALALWLILGPPLGFLVALFPAIVILTGDVYTNKINPDGSPKTWSRKFRLGPVVLCAITLLGTIFVLVKASQNMVEGSLDGDNGRSQTTTGGTQHVQRSARLSAPTSVEEAKRFMVGTWTYTGPDWKYMGISAWIKWVVKPDGTVMEYDAQAVDDTWGEPKLSNWEITSSKYTDTGERYFGFHIEGQAIQAVIRKDGKVMYHIPEGYLEMERGDKFPFSK